MISLIICSRDPGALAAVSQSVAATIGVAYEIIPIDNSKGQYGICEAYNLGAAQARYDLLCFMHEDIRFRTAGWGQTVVRLLADATIGVLGVTGGQLQVAAPAAWWGCGLSYCRENVVEIFADGRSEHVVRNPEGAVLTDVAVADGMWLCSRKEVWAQHPFDAQTFTEFHFYDVDYCTEIFRAGLRVCITFELVLEHHSRGNINAQWAHNALKYQHKRANQLPFGVVNIPWGERRGIELRALQEFVALLIRQQFARTVVAKYLVQCLLLSPFNRDTLWLTKQLFRAKPVA